MVPNSTFKVPTMGMKSKSKLPVAKEKLRKPNLKLRHSSPIKEPKNISKEVKASTPAPTVKEVVHLKPQKVATGSFPIEANRVNLNWNSVPIYTTKMEVIALKNTGTGANPTRFVMKIKDCPEVRKKPKIARILL